MNAVARQVRLVDGLPVLSLPPSASAMLRADETDNVYFHVATRDGKLLAGDRELPLPDAKSDAAVLPGEVYFRDIELKGQDVRVAYS